MRVCQFRHSRVSLERNGDIIHDLLQNVKGFCKSFLSFLKKVFGVEDRIGTSLSLVENPPAVDGGGIGDSAFVAVADQDAEVSSSTGASKMATPSKKPAPII